MTERGGDIPQRMKGHNVPLGVKPMRVALGDVATLLSPSGVLVGRHCHVIPWVQGVLGHCHVQIPRRRTK